MPCHLKLHMSWLDVIFFLEYESRYILHWWCFFLYSSLTFSFVQEILTCNNASYLLTFEEARKGKWKLLLVE